MPATAGAGATISVSDTTRNFGGGIAGASSTRYYLSVNYVVDGADIFLGARAVSALAPGARRRNRFAHYPAGTAAGTYYLLARADGDDTVVEVNEANNVYGSFITIGPDLAVVEPEPAVRTRARG
jgi:subtilase family serine protease